MPQTPVELSVVVPMYDEEAVLPLFAARLRPVLDGLVTDGVEAMSPVMNCSNIPVEVLEHTSPVRIERFELIPDSGGAGKYRGGCGIRKDVRVMADGAVLTLLGDRHAFAPYGVFGGAPGRVGESLVNSGNEAKALGSKEVAVLKANDVVSLRTSGAGGYGPPAERDPALIAADIANGYVTEAAARKSYGPRK